MLRGDEIGMFWEEVPEPRRGHDYGPRPLPPIPETGWLMPQGEGSFPRLEGQGWVALDVETFDPDLREIGPGEHRGGYIVGIAIGTEAGFRQYYPIRHDLGPNLPREQVYQWLSRELDGPAPKIGANLLYDLGFLAAEGVKVRGPFYDVQVAEPLLDENRLTYRLEVLAQHYLGEGKREDAMAKWMEKAFGSKENIKKNIWRAPASVVGPYAEGDVDLPLRIFKIQKLHLEAEELWDLFLLESRLIPMLLAMRQRGVHVDLDQAERLKATMTQRMDIALGQIKERTGHNIDIWAAESVAKMFDSIGVVYPRTEKTNAPSFRKGWLEACPAPEARLVVEARAMDKFRGTFIQGYILEGAINGIIHCQFLQLRSDEGGTVSGRLSSANPNLQNIPIRDEELGQQIRRVFIAEPEQQWWKFDWSQIEFRLAVHFAAVMKLRGADIVVRQYFEDPGTDYHEIVSKLTGLSRKYAKSINFGLVYGMGAEELCHQLGVEMIEGYRILRTYHNRVPFIKPLYNTASNRAKDRGEIVTMGGRHRRFHVWNKGNQYFRQAELDEQSVDMSDGGWQRAFTHKALNALLQGSAADIMKKGMVQLWESGVCDVIGAPHLTVHDELDGSYVPSKEGTEALAEIKNIMETCVTLKLPLRADGGTGPNWGSTGD